LRFAGLFAVAGVLSVLVLSPAMTSSLRAQQLLLNGGFEQGTANWAVRGPAGVCEPHAGTGAVALMVGAGEKGWLYQSLQEPPGQGAYHLTLQAKLTSGSATLSLELEWFKDGLLLAQDVTTVSPGFAYSPFTLTARAPEVANGLRVLLSAESTQSAATTICLDSVSLEGPPPAPPAPPPLPTQPPSTQPLPTQPEPPAAQPGPSQGVPAPGQESANTAVQVQADAASRVPTSSLVNGDFELGLLGWQKLGGELRLDGTRVHAGSSTGSLVSSTDSTKWAYQVVRVDPSLWYEFAGYVAADSGVSRAYLRISWYASQDGSGSQLATTDSTQTIAGGRGFVALSTGAVQPASSAASARLRIVMTPLGGAPATIFFDDMFFGSVPPRPNAAQAGSPGAGTAARSGRTISSPGGEDPADEDREANPITSAEPAEDGLPELAEDSDDGGGVPVLWLAAAGLLVLGLGGSYWRTHASGS
jgi:hypothetical protein